MACLYSITRLNPRYLPNKKNNGIVPVMTDPRKKYIQDDCGKCIECRKKIKNAWKVKLMEQIRQSPNDGNFITMTFSDEALIELEYAVNEKVYKMKKENKHNLKYNNKIQHEKLTGYNLDNQIAIIAFKRFREKIRVQNTRKKQRGEKETKFKIWAITEIGGKYTERLHLHAIIWTDNIKEIANQWQYGHVRIGNNQGLNYVNEKTINYITKYVTKADIVHKLYSPKILKSNNLGIEYLNRSDSKKHKYTGEDTNLMYITRTGTKYMIPKYYKQKLFTEEENEKIWMHSLDTGIKYVDGIKIDTKQNPDAYDKVIQMVREKNNRLGYPDRKPNKELREYENKKRNEIKEARILKVETERIKKLEAKHKEEAETESKVKQIIERNKQYKYTG